MAAITTAIAAGVSLAGIGLSAKQLVDQNKLMNDAKGAAQAAGAKLYRMKLENAYADMQVPTLGYELAQQGLDRQTMAALQAAQGAGAEGVIGGVGRINEAANEQELQMMAQLQQDELNRDKMVAEGQMYSDAINLKNARELEASRLTGAQEAMKQAQLNKQQAIQGMIGSGVSALGYLGSEDLIPLYSKSGDTKFLNSGKDLAKWSPKGTVSGYDAYGNKISTIDAPNQKSWTTNYLF